MADWYSIENLKLALRYAFTDATDNFTYDIINFEDYKQNRERMLASLHAQLANDQYYPAPLAPIAVPKNAYSVRPGTVIHLVDSIVLYAIAQQLAPALDPNISASAYAYRLNPRRDRSGEHLFRAQQPPKREEGSEEQPSEGESDSEDATEQLSAAFPYGWFSNWLEFHENTQKAAQKYEYVAVTDITAYFENISTRILFEQLRTSLNNDFSDLISRLERQLRYWDWASANNKPPGAGLPQGNDVSSFLSNLYLLDLDNAILEIVSKDPTKYHRYVDDVQIYTSNYDEARRALVKLESVLRTLGLNVQSAKTQIIRSDQHFDPDVLQWERQLQDDVQERYDNAKRFFSEEFDFDDASKLKKWDRIYRRALTVLYQGRINTQVPSVLRMFLENPSNKLLLKNFSYLQYFAAEYPFSESIVNAIQSQRFVFDYHLAYMFRLAAYCRDENAELKGIAMERATNATRNWFVRIAALHYLMTCRLSPNELSQIMNVITSESNPDIVRAAYIVLTQHSGKELEIVLDNMSYFNARYQEYLRAYFNQLIYDENHGRHVCAAVRNMRIDDQEFIRCLHKLDLVKANSNCRVVFDELISQKIHECGDSWPRLRRRLDGIKQQFVQNPFQRPR